MADIYVFSIATTNYVLTPVFFHSFEKAQAYMLEWFDHFLRKALDRYDHILGDKEKNEVYVGDINIIDNGTLIFADTN